MSAAKYVVYPCARRPPEKLELHYTPKHGSWLSMGGWSSAGWRGPTRTAGQARAIGDSGGGMYQVVQSSGVGVDGQFTTDDARIRLKRPCSSIESRRNTGSAPRAGLRT